MRRSLLVDLDLDVLDLGQHGDGRGRGVDAPLRLGRRNALHAVHAGLELHLRVDLVALDAERDFLEAAALGLVGVDLLDLPLLEVGVARVHAVEVAREDGGLVAAGARADLDDDVLVVVGVARKQHDLELFLELGQRRLELLDLLGGELLHVLIALGAQDFLRLVELLRGAEVLAGLLGELGLRALRLGQARVLLLVAEHGGIAELGGQLVEGGEDLSEASRAWKRSLFTSGAEPSNGITRPRRRTAPRRRAARTRSRSTAERAR